MGHSPQERVLRRYVKQVMMESQVRRPSVRPPPRRPVNEVLLRSLIREQLTADGFRVMTDWEVVREWAHRPAGLNEWGLPGRDLLAEGIMDDFLGGVERAVDWVKEKGGEAIEWSADSVNKALTIAQQKADVLKTSVASGAELVKKGVVYALEKIDVFMAAAEGAGKKAYGVVGGVFEMLKTFSAEALNSGANAVFNLFKHFINWVKENYGGILKFVTGHIGDKKVSEKIKRMALRSEDDVKEAIQQCLKSPKDAATIIMAKDMRGVAGAIVKGIMQVVFFYFKEVPEKIKTMLLSSDIAADLGMKGFETALRLLFIAAGSMEGTSAYVANGLKAYQCLKELGQRSADDDTLEIDIDIEMPDGKITTVGPETDLLEAIVSVLPEIMQGVISGKNLSELSIRAGFGDVKSLIDLIGKTIKIILKTFMKIVESNMPEILEKCGIDPNSPNIIMRDAAKLLTTLIPAALGFAVYIGGGSKGGG